MPKISPDNTWLIWDVETGDYVDTGIKASGGGGITVTNTAAVGQTIKITAVDENGKPTEWKAVDMTSGWTVTDDGNGNVVIGG